MYPCEEDVTTIGLWAVGYPSWVHCEYTPPWIGSSDVLWVHPDPGYWYSDVLWVHPDHVYWSDVLWVHPYPASTIDTDLPLVPTLLFSDPGSAGGTERYHTRARVLPAQTMAIGGYSTVSTSTTPQDKRYLASCHALGTWHTRALFDLPLEKLSPLE